MQLTHNPSPITRNLAKKHTFSSKERDAETGLSYFGARYYSSDLSLWLSVAPMADKYPSLSPYTYCANNPVKLVDPNGEEWTDIDGKNSSQFPLKGTKQTLMHAFRNTFDFYKVRGTSDGVRYDKTTMQPFPGHSYWRSNWDYLERFEKSSNVLLPTRK